MGNIFGHFTNNVWNYSGVLRLSHVLGHTQMFTIQTRVFGNVEVSTSEHVPTLTISIATSIC